MERLSGIAGLSSKWVLLYAYLVPDIPYTPYIRLGEGERHAIGLAAALGADLLVNEHKAYQIALGQGLSVICLPKFIVLIHYAGMINEETALRYLERTANVTAKPLIDAAKDYILNKRTRGGHTYA